MVVLISVITFVVIRLMPGDPAFLLLGEGEIRISAEQMEGIRKRWGLGPTIPRAIPGLGVESIAR